MLTHLLKKHVVLTPLYI